MLSQIVNDLGTQNRYFRCFRTSSEYRNDSTMADDDNYSQTIDKTVKERKKNQHLLKRQMLTLAMTWIIWILLGTVTYAYANENQWREGFYMAVSIGNCIGFGNPVEINDSVKIFSIFYLLSGCVGIIMLKQYRC